MPELGTYNLLAGFVQAEQNPDGTLSQCGIVSTFFQKEGRSFTDFDDFHDFRPHGVEGSTATTIPAAGRQLYFNESVLPDPLQQSSSRDGGVLWVDVETDVYEITADSDTTRHAGFVATCEPGRLVNANPPWGLYELAGNEEVNPAALPDTELRARVTSSKLMRRPAAGPRRVLRLEITSRERVTAGIRIRQQKRLTSRRVRVEPGGSRIVVPVPKGFKRGHARLRVVLTDAAGNSGKTAGPVHVPRSRR